MSEIQLPHIIPIFKEEENIERRTLSHASISPSCSLRESIGSRPLLFAGVLLMIVGVQMASIGSWGDD